MWSNTLESGKIRRLVITQQAEEFPHFSLTDELLQPKHPTSWWRCLENQNKSYICWCINTFTGGLFCVVVIQINWCLYSYFCQSPWISWKKVLLHPLGSLQACVSQQVWASPGRGCVWTPHEPGGDSSQIVFFIKMLHEHRQDKSPVGVEKGVG